LRRPDGSISPGRIFRRSARGCHRTQAPRRR
jgi:hypothetical protein